MVVLDFGGIICNNKKTQTIKERNSALTNRPCFYFANTGSLSLF